MRFYSTLLRPILFSLPPEIAHHLMVNVAGHVGRVAIGRALIRSIYDLQKPELERSLFGLKGSIDWGASPRASIALKECARSLAFLRGRNFVSPDEVRAVAHDVLRHRILPSFESEARGVDSDELIKVLLGSITVP